jgi:hypothetical protein
MPQEDISNIATTGIIWYQIFMNGVVSLWSLKHNRYAKIYVQANQVTHNSCCQTAFIKETLKNQLYDFSVIRQKFCTDLITYD